MYCRVNLLNKINHRFIHIIDISQVKIVEDILREFHYFNNYTIGIWKKIEEEEFLY